MLIEMAKFLDSNGGMNIEGSGMRFSLRKTDNGVYIQGQNIAPFTHSLHAVEWVVQQIGGSDKVTNYGV